MNAYQRLSRLPVVSCLIIASSCFISCAEVKSYQRVHLNNPEMETTTKDCAHFETYFQVIREGASGAGGGKTGGGCGCN